MRRARWRGDSNEVNVIPMRPNENDIAAEVIITMRMVVRTESEDHFSWTGTRAALNRHEEG